MEEQMTKCEQKEWEAAGRLARAWMDETARRPRDATATYVMTRMPGHAVMSVDWADGESRQVTRQVEVGGEDGDQA